MKRIRPILALCAMTSLGFAEGKKLDNKRAANTVVLDETGVKNLRIETVEVDETDFEEIVFARPGTTAVTADPDKRNVASIRAFEKAGFRVVREFHDPEDDAPHVLVRRARS